MQDAAQERRCIVTREVSIAYPEKDDPERGCHRTEQIGALAGGKAPTECYARGPATKHESVEQLPGCQKPEKGQDDEQDELHSIEMQALKGHGRAWTYPRSLPFPFEYCQQHKCGNRESCRT